MKIRLITMLAGPNGVLHPGEHEVSDELGTQLVLGRFAEPVGQSNEDPDPVEESPKEDVTPVAEGDRLEDVLQDIERQPRGRGRGRE